MLNLHSKSIQTSQGFTLLELLIAIAIFAVVASLLYTAYTGTYRNIDAAESQAEIYQMARIALDRIIDDLESANIPDESNPDFFLGKDDVTDARNTDSLRFISRAHISLNDMSTNSGNAKIGYYVKKKEEESEEPVFTLYRSDVLENLEWPEDETGGLVLCEGLYSINFTYYDQEGEKYDYWDSSNDMFKRRMPSLVSIMIEFYNKTDPESPFRFSTAVALPLAGRK